MNAYLTSPVTPIVLGVITVAALIAIVLTIRSNHRKEREWQQEKRAMEKRVRDAIAAEMADKPKARRVAPRVVPLPRSARTGRYKKPESVPAPGHSGFRKDRDPVYNDTTAALIATGILFDHDPHDHGSRNDSPSYDPSPSPSYDSGSSSSSSSYDSGSSSSSSDSSSSFSSDSGGSGSF